MSSIAVRFASTGRLLRDVVNFVGLLSLILVAFL
jgi:hypothetical protein